MLIEASTMSKSKKLSWNFPVWVSSLLSWSTNEKRSPTGASSPRLTDTKYDVRPLYSDTTGR